jgi:hypothetical protein
MQFQAQSRYLKFGVFRQRMDVIIFADASRHRVKLDRPPAPRPPAVSIP